MLAVNTTVVAADQSLYIKIYVPYDGQKVWETQIIRVMTNIREPVKIRIDDGPWHEMTKNGNHFMYKWDTTTVDDGGHEITVKAWNGKEYSDSVYVVVLNNHSLDEIFPAGIYVDKKVYGKKNINVSEGSDLKFKITVINVGRTTYPRLFTLDFLPPFLKYDRDASCTPTPYKYNSSQNTLLWYLQNFTPKSRIEITYHAKVIAPDISDLRDLLDTAAQLRLIGAQMKDNPLVIGIEYLSYLGEQLKQVDIYYLESFGRNDIELQNNLSVIGRKLKSLGTQIQDNISLTGARVSDQATNNFIILGGQLQKIGEELQEILLQVTRPFFIGTNTVFVLNVEGNITAEDRVMIKREIEPKLSIRYLFSSIAENHSFLLYIIDNLCNPIEGAIVQFNGETNLTNENGMVTFVAPEVEENTTFEITAHKLGYTNVTTTIVVNNRESNTSIGEAPHNSKKFYIASLNETGSVTDVILENSTFYIIAFRNNSDEIEGIPGVFISFGNQSGFTNNQGLIQFTAPPVDNTTQFIINATKDRYTTSLSILIKDIPANTTSQKRILDEKVTILVFSLVIASLVITLLLVVALFRKLKIRKRKQSKPTCYPTFQPVDKPIVDDLYKEEPIYFEPIPEETVGKEVYSMDNHIDTVIDRIIEKKRKERATS